MAGGGFTLVAAPTQATASWFGGGYTPAPVSSQRSIVDRITYATDTATATVRGPLGVGINVGAYYTSATGTLTYGWYAFGTTGAGTSSTISRITYATDSATSTTRGGLPGPVYAMAASTDSTTYGWFAGGISPPTSSVQRITFATDTNATTPKGPLSLARYSSAATNTTSYGWFAGGKAPSPSGESLVDRIDYSNDTATASVRGPLSSARWYHAASGDGTTYGYYVAGRDNLVGLTSITRITYATDTATSTNRGLYIIDVRNLAGSGNSTYGYFGAGANISSVGRIDYSNDTATAATKGPLSAARYALGSSSGQQ